MRRDDGGGQVADAEAVDLALDPGPFQRGGVEGVEAGVQLQRRGLQQAAFQQAARQFQKLALGLVFVDVDQREVLPHDQPVDDRFQHGGLADARPAGQQQVAALARLPRDLLDQVVPPDQAGDVFHDLPLRQLPQFAAQVVQQRSPLIPGVVGDLAALGVEQQVQPLGGGGFGVLLSGPIPTASPRRPRSPS